MSFLPLPITAECMCCWTVCAPTVTTSLGAGGRSEKHLWAGNVHAQIKKNAGVV